MRVRIGADGKPPAPFTHPVQPQPEAVGTCSKCGGNTHADDFTSWTKETGTVQKRTYRCMQHGHRCPTNTVILGQDGQEEGAVAKPKTVNCTQTLEWCEAQKAAMLAKHLAYRDVAKDAAISQSALAQGLTMKMSLSVETQARVEQAIASADPAVALKVRKERDCRKPKKTQLPASLQVSPEKVNAWAAQAEKELQDQVMSNLAAQESIDPSAVITCDYAKPMDGLIPPLVTPEGQVKAYPHDDDSGTQTAGVILNVTTPRFTPEVLDSLLHAGIITLKEAAEMAEKEKDKLPVGSPERRLLALYNNYYDLVQRQKAVEARVQSVAEKSEATDTDLDAWQARVVQLEDRLTETYDHLTEQIAGLQPPAVVDDAVDGDWRIITARPADGLDFWLEEQKRNQVLSPDELVTSLSRYSDSQLAALVAAATARREMLKAMEAA